MANYQHRKLILWSVSFFAASGVYVAREWYFYHQTTFTVGPLDRFLWADITHIFGPKYGYIVGRLAVLGFAGAGLLSSLTWWANHHCGEYTSTKRWVVSLSQLKSGKNHSTDGITSPEERHDLWLIMLSLRQCCRYASHVTVFGIHFFCHYCMLVDFPALSWSTWHLYLITACWVGINFPPEHIGPAMFVCVPGDLMIQILWFTLRMRLIGRKLDHFYASSTKTQEVIDWNQLVAVLQQWEALRREFKKYKPIICVMLGAVFYYTIMMQIFAIYVIVHLSSKMKVVLVMAIPVQAVCLIASYGILHLASNIDRERHAFHRTLRRLLFSDLLPTSQLRFVLAKVYIQDLPTNSDFWLSCAGTFRIQPDSILFAAAEFTCYYLMFLSINGIPTD